MSRLQQPNELPHGWHKSYQFNTEAEAIAFAIGRICYLYHSRVIETMYILFVPVTGSESK